MPEPRPLLIDCHPLFAKLMELAKDEKTLKDIRDGGSPAERFGKIRGDGLLDVYEEEADAEGAQTALRDGMWGDADTFTHISDSFGDACELVQSTKKPLRISWAAGALTTGVEVRVVESAAEVAMVILTKELDPELLASGKGFDAGFFVALRELGGRVQRLIDELPR